MGAPVTFRRGQDFNFKLFINYSGGSESCD